MKTILRRLAQLERRQPVYIMNRDDPLSKLTKELDRLAERMRLDGDWPDPRPTPAEVQEAIQRLVGSGTGRSASA